MNIVFAGGGHASLPAIGLAHGFSDEHSFTLINDHPWLYYSGMIPEFLGGTYGLNDIRIDLEKYASEHNCAFVQGRVTGINRAQKKVEILNQNPISYDLLVLDVGSETPFVPDSPRSQPVKPLYILKEIDAFIAHSIGARELSLAIIGGGAAGCEIALNLSTKYRSCLKLTLVHNQKHLLPVFPKWVGEEVRRRLEKRAVTVYLESRGSEDNLNADLLIWATGTKGYDWFAESGLETDERGFILTDDTLQSSDSAIFAAGDCATLRSKPDLAKVGIHAVKQGPLLAENLKRVIENGDQASLKPFKPYLINPLILSTGVGDAYWGTKSFALRGKWALKLKHYLDQRFVGQYSK